MPQIFSAEAFERILFPMHQEVYAGIEMMLQRLEADRPGFLKSLERLYAHANALPPGHRIDVTVLDGAVRPDDDIRIEVDCPDLKKLRKCTGAQIRNVPHAALWRGRLSGMPPDHQPAERATSPDLHGAAGLCATAVRAGDLPGRSIPGLPASAVPDGGDAHGLGREPRCPQ